MTVNPTAAFAVLIALAWVLAPGRPLAQPASARGLNAYAQDDSGRPRARLRVTPRYPYRTESLPYPPPYPIEYPGPGFMRQCKSRLVPEARPSGTVIVQRTQCWWEPGRGEL